MKKFIEIKEEVKNKVNEKLHKEETEMNEEKKGMPKWLKITGGALLGAGALGGAYLFGKHKGAGSSEDVYDDEDYEDEDFVEDLDATEE